MCVFFVPKTLQHVSQWRVHDVLQWMSVTGLSRYAEVFNFHNVNGDFLTKIQDNALKVM